MKILIIMVFCCARFNYCIGFVFIVLDLSLLFDDVLFCLPFCWCPCMAINVSVQYDGGFLPDIILLTQCCYHRETRLNYEEVLYFLLIPPKRFDIFPP